MHADTPNYVFLGLPLAALLLAMFVLVAWAIVCVLRKQRGAQIVLVVGLLGSFFVGLVLLSTLLLFGVRLNNQKVLAKTEEVAKIRQQTQREISDLRTFERDGSDQTQESQSTSNSTEQNAIATSPGRSLPNVSIPATADATHQVPTFDRTASQSFNIKVNHSMPALWSESDTEPFTVSVYPGVAATAEPLAKLVLETLKTRNLMPLNDDGAEKQLDTIQVSLDDSLNKHRAAMEELFLAKLNQVFPDRQITTKWETTDTPPDLQIELSLAGEYENAAWDAHEQVWQGQITCTITTTKGASTIRKRIMEKPWVEQFDQFVSEHPRQRYVVGYSSELMSSESDAQELALQDAQSKVEVLVSGVKIRIGEHQVVDRFAQTLSRPYGEVWREAVLLDLSNAAMAPMVDQAQMKIQQTRSTRISQSVAFVILLTVSSLLCVVFNSFTQGYYRQRIGLGFAFLAIGAVIAVVMLS